ncbi:hypothetical protein NKJ13_07850 [Mesorhizobium sp. M0174]|uniref:hypothetical protein n=1 Tax=Mesorhizobium sp. M0174 TaxID=2956904 RepID=UPI0033386178
MAAAVLPAVAAPALSRKEKIKACLEELDALLCEETGLPWNMALFSSDWVEIDGQRELLHIAVDRRFAGLHDVSGVAGPRLRYGKPF